MKLAVSLKALPLVALSGTEISVAFIRTMILTRLLGPHEFGFATAISAAYSTIEQVTDLAIYRFVLSSPRSVYKDALAGAHALAIIRGAVVSALILSSARPLACTYTECSDWPSFAVLALATIIRSLEHLEIRVAERDYRYSRQLSAAIASHGVGIAALAATAYFTESHYGLIVYYIVQCIVFNIFSHLLATVRYIIAFRTPFLLHGLAFGFPLMLNGVGLAIIGQGDRLMVGAMLGVTFLGPYAVLTLAALIPISALTRIIGPLQFAGLHNARKENGEYESRLQLFTRAVPMIAACYALGLIGLLKTLIPLVFGSRFVVSNVSMLLLALIAFVRISRLEPHTSLLLQTHMTRGLAISNQSAAVGLLVGAGLVYLHPSIEAALVGVLVGDTVSLVVFVWATHKLMKSMRLAYYASLMGMLGIVLSASVVVFLTRSADIVGERIAISILFGVIVLAGAGTFLRKPFASGYSKQLSPA